MFIMAAHNAYQHYIPSEIAHSTKTAKHTQLFLTYNKDYNALISLPRQTLRSSSVCANNRPSDHCLAKL